MWLNILQGTIEQGLAFSLLAMGVYLPFRILDFPDLTVEGSFRWGGSECGFNHKRNEPFLATFIAMLAGVVAGMTTGLINTKLKITGLPPGF